MALYHLGPTPTKIADAADDPFIAQCQSGYGMRAAFGAEPDVSVLGLLIEVGEAVTRSHGAGDVFAWAADPPPGLPPQTALVEVQI